MRKRSMIKDNHNVEVMSHKLVRITYDGTGIYDALKSSVCPLEWKRLQKTPSMTWLPKPTVDYKKGYNSYFTELGYHTFLMMTQGCIASHLDIDSNKYKVQFYDREEILKGHKIIYEDKYQVVVE